MVVPWELRSNVNACSIPRAAGLRYVGGAASIAHCSEAAAAWRNATAPAERCRAACWRADTLDGLEPAFAGACSCVADAEWFPAPADGAASSRLLWPCESSDDCAHNGECGFDGACACDVGWTGPYCERLDLDDVDESALGYRASDASSWGMPVLYAGGRFHGWASEIAGSCGINAWETNSQIVHVVAEAAAGPYERREVVRAAFAHEPDVVRGPNGRFVMAYSSFPLDDASTPSRNASFCGGCANGTTPPIGGACPYQRGAPQALHHEFRQMLAVAPGPDGPWTASREDVRRRENDRRAS